jgi:hypothetical protein
MTLERISQMLIGMLLTKMFPALRVAIEIGADAIVITLSCETPPGHIVVFYSRVCQKMSPARVPVLLAHVLAHEIAHILQGVQRHSESGLMKPQRDDADFFEMARKPLGFTEEDVDLIYRGLDARKFHAASAPLIAARY